MQADAVHLSAEDPSGLSSHLRLVVVVATGRNNPPQVHVPGATYIHEPCDSRGGKVGFPAPQHPPLRVRQCRRITTVDLIKAQEDTPLTLKGVYIEDFDVDEAGPGAQIDVNVESQHGYFGFSEGPPRPIGIFFLPSGSPKEGKHLLTMRGALGFINAALARLTYIPDPDWSGFDEVIVRADDRGFTGSGGAATDSRGIPIEVIPRNDAPLLVVTLAGVAGAGETVPPPPLEMWEDSRMSLHNVTLYDADINPGQLHGQIFGISSNTPYEEYPADLTGGLYEVTVKAESGRIFFPRTVGLTFEPASIDITIGENSAGQTMALFNQGAKFTSSNLGNFTSATNKTPDRGDLDALWWREARFSGGLHDCNRVIAAMTYWPNVNWNGVDSVHVSVFESRSDGIDGKYQEMMTPWPLAAEVSMFIRVLAINDAPVVTPPSPRLHSNLRAGDFLSPIATYGSCVFVVEDSELLLPGFVIRDVDLSESGDENALMTVTVTCRHGEASITWHGARAGVGPGDSRHPLEENSLGADLTGLLFHDEQTGKWAPWNGGMGKGQASFTFRATLADANAVLQSLAFKPTGNFFGRGAWVRVEAFDEGQSGHSFETSGGAMSSTFGNTDIVSARGVATVPVTVLADNDAPSLQLPFSEDGGIFLRLDEGEERRLEGVRWRGTFAAAVQASAYFPLRKGIELWRSQGIFPGKDAGRWGKGVEMAWKETLVADLNEGLGDGSPRHFVVWGGYLYFQVVFWTILCLAQTPRDIVHRSVGPTSNFSRSS